MLPSTKTVFTSDGTQFAFLAWLLVRGVPVSEEPIFSVPPMFWIPSQLEGAYIGKDVTLECHSEAFPKSINYWVKEDGAMLISSRLIGANTSGT